MTRPKFSVIPAVLLVVGCVLLPACRARSKRYDLRGQVLEKNVPSSEITVNHEDIPGFMAAMTMPYKVKDEVGLQALQPGDMITARVVTSSDGKDYWLEDIRITDQSARARFKGTVTAHRLEPGAHAPDLPLINQEGATIHLADFKGKAVLVTFIYTRCPMPTFCPRLSSQFAKIHDALKKTPDDYRRTHLLSISFDPKYDSAPVLRKYGLAYLDNDPTGFAHWEFASTTPADLHKLAEAFGLDYLEEGNQISHTMVVALIAPDGTIVRYWANEWTTAELETALRQAAHTATANRRDAQ